MKIKQMIFALIMVLVVNGAQAHPTYIVYMEDPGLQEEPKSQLCKEQADRFFQGENPPFSLDKLPLNRVAWFMNRMPEDRIVAAVDFYLSHLGVDGGKNPVLGFKHAGRGALFPALNALRILSPGDYQRYFDYALQIVGPRTGDNFLDSRGLVRAFECVSLHSDNAIGLPVPKKVIEVPLVQLKELKSYTRGDEVEVFRNLALAQIGGPESCFVFLKALFKLPCTKGVRASTLADAAYSYCSDNPRDPLNEVTLRRCMEKIRDVEFQLSLERMRTCKIKTQLKKACELTQSARLLGWLKVKSSVYKKRILFRD